MVLVNTFDEYIIIQRSPESIMKHANYVKNKWMPELSLQVTVELSDGWYCIPAKLDVPLLDLINRRRIQTGHKLCTTGAELVGSQDPCTPLEVRPGLCTCLRLYVIYLCDSNSCFRYKSHAKIASFSVFILDFSFRKLGTSM